MTTKKKEDIQFREVLLSGLGIISLNMEICIYFSEKRNWKPSSSIGESVRLLINKIVNLSSHKKRTAQDVREHLGLKGPDRTEKES